MFLSVFNELFKKSFPTGCIVIFVFSFTCLYMFFYGFYNYFLKNAFL